MKYLLLIFLASPCYALSPPPINLTREIIEIDGELLEVSYGEEGLSVNEIGPVEAHWWEISWLACFIVFSSLGFAWVYMVFPYYLIGYFLTYSTGIFVLFGCALYCVVMANSHDNPVYERPKVGEAARMTVNYRVNKNSIISYEVFWDEELNRWRGELAGEFFELKSLPKDDSDTKIYPTEWME